MAMIKQRQNKIRVVKFNKLCRCHPKSFDDIMVCISDLSDSGAFLIDLNGTPEEQRQRYLDYLCGAVFALSGRVKKCSDNEYLFVGSNVEVVEAL